MHFQCVYFKRVRIQIFSFEYQENTLIVTMEHYIVNTDKYSELLFSCDMCETEIIIMVRKSLTCFTNILLNDYTTAEKVSTTKIFKNI